MLAMDLRLGDFVSLLTSVGITKGVVMSCAVEGYFVTVQWIIRPFMDGKVTTHRQEDLYKLAYRGAQAEGRGGLPPTEQNHAERASAES